MCESAVCFGHFMHIFLAFESTALVVECINDFSSEFVGHSLAATLAGIGDKVFH